ncbi:hypothetical protein VTN49DRAFT_3892 [Thermomyces lanuginosus]|uniref:uncharacterized protein n=1 Tax=Thermomyces lanuginosus TaxID=5541 RepID=UPI003743C081
MEHRTYLWLHLTFDIIEQSPSEYGRVSDVEALLSSLPSQVSEAYERILERSKNEFYTETLLQIVLAAARPLTLDEANAALALGVKKGRFESLAYLESSMWPRENFKNTVKNLCGLFVSTHESKLSFVHQTAREFLTHPEMKGKWQGRLSVSGSQIRMLKMCLDYMSYPDERMRVSDIRAKFPFAQYSARYWIDHAKSLETEKDAQESILGFFLHREKAYSVWGRVYDPNFLFPERMRYKYPMASPIYYASLVGLRRTVELLLNEGRDVNSRGGHFGSPFLAACSGGHTEIVQLLLTRGADVNAQGGEYGNALLAACAECHKDTVELLLERDVDINAPNGGYYGNALQAACGGGNKDAVQLLLERGADINAQGGRCGTALQAACHEVYIEVVKLLLAKGADVNAQGGEYGNSLQAAAVNGT